MTALRRRLPRTWLLALLVVILLAAHGIVIYRLASHLAVAVIIGVLLLLLATHLGVFGSIYAVVRRRARMSHD